jgi:hypothetical protein
MFSDTFAGIAPSSVPPFIAMQLLGAVIGTGIAGDDEPFREYVSRVLLGLELSVP